MMIELFDCGEYKEIKKRYNGKIVLIIPYAEKRVKLLKEKMKLIKLKRNNTYNYFKSAKYSNYDYFILISLTDVNNEIIKIKKMLEEYYGRDG